jgi:hypothetical protein
MNPQGGETSRRTEVEDTQRPTLEDILEPAASRSQVAELQRKVDQLMQFLTARGFDQSLLESTSTPDEVTVRGEKRPREETSISETPPAARVRVNTEDATIRYVARPKEPNVPLPDAFDGDPRHLKKFLTELDLCFRAAPSKYAGDDAKVVTAGRLCSGTKVYPWWNTWLARWKKQEEGFRTWEDFETGIRSEFKDHLEKKEARAKLKRTKQTGKIREYISLMQSLNLDAGYDEEIVWETIYDGLKPKLKEMWAMIDNPPEDLREKYAKLVKLGAIIEDNEADQKKAASGESGEKEKEKKK